MKRVLDRFYVNSPGYAAAEGDAASVHLNQDRAVERSSPGNEVMRSNGVSKVMGSTIVFCTETGSPLLM